MMTDTQKHIEKVSNYIEVFANMLSIRGSLHDRSKLVEPELSGFKELAKVAENFEYGSSQYRQALQQFKPIIKHHYESNDHHAEHKRAISEEWRPVIGYEGLYEVSNFGEVKSLDRIAEREKTGDMFIKGNIRKPHITPKGYLRLQLSKDGKSQSKLVHSLVVDAFIPNPENKKCVDHRDHKP